MNTSSKPTAIIRPLHASAETLDTPEGTTAKQVLIGALSELGSTPESILSRLEQIGQRGQTVLIG